MVYHLFRQKVNDIKTYFQDISNTNLIVQNLKVKNLPATNKNSKQIKVMETSEEEFHNFLSNITYFGQ